jgi:predicted TIM-barrel fold metal-dependent hydrolase
LSASPRSIEWPSSSERSPAPCARTFLFSTDFPYQYRPGQKARRFLEGLPLDDEAKHRFAHRNWERLVGA